MTWPEFWKRHGERKYAPIYNDFFDSLIVMSNLPPTLRVLAWILRNSWGRWSDAVVNAEGTRQGQADCARDLALFRKNPQGKLEPYRAKVGPIFAEFEAWNIIRFEGRDIVPIDNPSGLDFAYSSPFVEPNFTNGKEKANGVEWFLENVWKLLEPEAYEAYQKAVADYKPLRLRLVNDHKQYAAATENSSERGSTNEGESQNGSDANVGMGADNASDWGTTNAGPSLNEPVTVSLNDPSSSFSSLVRERLSRHGNVDDDALNAFLKACQTNAPDCTPTEVCDLIDEKAKLITDKIRNPVKFLCVAVEKCFAGESFTARRAKRARQEAAARDQHERQERELEELERQQNSPEWLENEIVEYQRFIAKNPGHVNARHFRQRIAEYEARLATLRKPAASEAEKRARKAGQA